MTADEVGFLTRPDLPDGFERWEVRVPVGARRATTASEWAGALVRVEGGTLEVRCVEGGRQTFGAGELLALGWLPLVELRSIGEEELRLVAVRRRGSDPRQANVRITRVKD